MDTSASPRVAFAEKLDGGVVIEFANGQCALYSADLLYQSFPLAQNLTDLPADDLE